MDISTKWQSDRDAAKARESVFFGSLPDKVFDAIKVCWVFNLVNWFLEGTGLNEYRGDPIEPDEETLENCRSKTFYTDFGRSNGIDI